MWSVCSQYIRRNYGENPENFSEALKRLERLRQVSCRSYLRTSGEGELFRVRFLREFFLHSANLWNASRGTSAVVPEDTPLHSHTYRTIQQRDFPKSFYRRLKDKPLFFMGVCMNYYSS